MKSWKAPIEVPEALARAYREASPEQRERASKYAAEQGQIQNPTGGDGYNGAVSRAVEGQLQATVFRCHPSDFV